MLVYAEGGRLSISGQASSPDIKAGVSLFLPNVCSTLKPVQTGSMQFWMQSPMHHNAYESHYFGLSYTSDRKPRVPVTNWPMWSRFTAIQQLAFKLIVLSLIIYHILNSADSYEMTEFLSVPFGWKRGSKTVGFGEISTAGFMGFDSAKLSTRRSVILWLRTRAYIRKRENICLNFSEGTVVKEIVPILDYLYMIGIYAWFSFIEHKLAFNNVLNCQFLLSWMLHGNLSLECIILKQKSQKCWRLGLCHRPLQHGESTVALLKPS
jgi:hypothetical protein